ncbi:hypothetical protein O1611_g9558 [Lasiodiplodia mahajangana]|uniref:Uncharacterized protein n=1 Tax=Lasiodiplodia mahajangana TaxID=1108764 RepID=A0ACC2J840_9PEZI|nr:hypothetical protein O1611_g9558 [Lasiodiplodia mahajangana]
MAPNSSASSSSQWPDNTGQRQLPYAHETSLCPWPQDFFDDDVYAFDMPQAPLLPPDIFGTQSSQRGNVSLCSLTTPDEEVGYPRAKRQKRQDSCQQILEMNSQTASISLPSGVRDSENPPAPSTVASASKKFACPFLKQAGKMYQSTKDWKCCLGPGPGWETISRLKEHLYRKHSTNYQCPRCLDAFEDDSALHQHQRSKTPCPIRTHDGPGIGRLDTDQLNQLKKRRRCISDEEKWSGMYRTIFRLESTADIPSPYYEDIIPVPNMGSSSSSDGDSLHQFLSYLQARLLEGDDETYGNPSSIRTCIGLVEHYQRVKEQGHGHT